MTTQPPLIARPIGHGGMEPMIVASSLAFGDEATPEFVKGWQRILERDRTFEIVDGDLVVGGGSVFSFTVSVPGGAQVPAGGLTGVGVLPSHRRRGGLRALIDQVLADGISRGEPLSVLWASEGPIYRRFGYGVAALRATSIVGRQHIRFVPPVPEIGRIRLLSVAEALRHLPAVWDELARTTPGVFGRSEAWWRDEVLDDAEWRRQGAGVRFIPAIEMDGAVRGYGFYRWRTEWDHLGSRSILEVREVVAPDPAAELALWRFLAEMDLMGTLKAQNLPVDTPLFHRVDDPRRLGLTIGDGLWVRILDLPAALTARSWSADDDLVLEVIDDLLPANAGRWRLTVRDGRAVVARTDAAPDATLGIAALGSLYLGGVRAADLARAGHLVAPDPATPGRIDALDIVARQPWCPAIF
jgi:predicted acetyltransferase